jgi:hypothetical protein
MQTEDALHLIRNPFHFVSLADSFGHFPRMRGKSS